MVMGVKHHAKRLHHQQGKGAHYAFKKHLKRTAVSVLFQVSLKALPEAPALVSCLKNFAMMRDSIEESIRHFGVVEDLCPLSEFKVCRYNNRCFLIKFRERMKEKLPPVTRKR